MEEVSEGLVDVKAARVHAVLWTTLAFLVASRTSTATPTGDAITILLIVQGKLMDMTMQQRGRIGLADQVLFDELTGHSYF